jgi:hypothetical protein
LQKSLSEGRNTSYRTAELVKLISEIGPDIPEISRRLGQFKESVRYRYKEKVLGRGFGVQASINHEKLGMHRVVIFAEFAPQYTQYANSILTAMNELCYVVAFEKRMFRGDYYIEASVPSEHVGSFVSFLSRLRDIGLFTSLETHQFDLFRTVPMQADHYDFDTGRWDFDWSASMQPQPGSDYDVPERVKIDKDDLLILKELQMDATRSFVEIAGKLKTNYKTLAWHYKNHVLKSGMISSYNLRWMGTTYDTVLERALHRRHKYQQLAILAVGLTEVQRMTLMSHAHAVPYIWSELVGRDSYLAHFFFPTENITEAYQYLTKAISDAKEKVLVMPLDQTEALAFTVSYQLYDGKQWQFDEEGLIAKFSMLLQKIEEIGGT